MLTKTDMVNIQTMAESHLPLREFMHSDIVLTQLFELVGLLGYKLKTELNCSIADFLMPSAELIQTPLELAPEIEAERNSTLIDFRKFGEL